MEGFPSRRVLETLLSRKPREYSLEVGALSVLTILGISLLAWQNGAALLPILAATSEGALAEHEYWRLTRPIFCTNRSESLHRSLGL